LTPLAVFTYAACTNAAWIIYREEKMDGKKPIDMLEQEHRVIEKIINAMTALITMLEADKEVDVDVLRKMAAFMSGFGDTCHHAKEEKELFPLLIKKGVPEQGCPIAILTYEHETGRRLVTDLSGAIMTYEKKDASPKAQLLKQLRELTKLYPDHIWKEEYLLFPMANKILDDNDQKELQLKFEMIEKAIGPDAHAHYEQLAAAVDLQSHREKEGESSNPAGGTAPVPGDECRSCNG